MKNIIPFTKEITFDNKISEITSISLEEEYNYTNDSIDGEFKIFGDYKTHELSINKEPFEYKLPFSVDLTENIKKDTLSFEITDFSYDILNDNILKVNIEFEIEGEVEEKEDKLEETLEILEDREDINEEDNIIDANSTIIDSINEDENEFTTYHIHIVKESETIESICALYNIDSNLLSNYNDLTNFKTGDKLIVVDE